MNTSKWILLLIAVISLTGWTSSMEAGAYQRSVTRNYVDVGTPYYNSYYDPYYNYRPYYNDYYYNPSYRAYYYPYSSYSYPRYYYGSPGFYLSAPGVSFGIGF